MGGAGDASAGVVGLGPGGDVVGHARATAEEEDALAGGGEAGQQEGEEIGTVDVLANFAAQDAAGDAEADAIGEAEMAVDEGVAVSGVAMGEIDAIDVDEGDLAEAGGGGDDGVDGLIHGEIVEREAEDVGAVVAGAAGAAAVDGGE